MTQATRDLHTVTDVRDKRRLEVRVYGEFTAVPGQRKAWNNLVDISTYPNVFLRWEWITTWWKWFGEGRQLHLIVVLDGSEVVGIAPLYLATARFGFPFRAKKLAFIGAGGPTCPEYLGPIVHRDYVEAVIQEVARHLQFSHLKWTVIEFPDVAPDDAGTRALVEALSVDCPAVHSRGEASYYLPLPESYEALLKRLTRNRRRQERVRVRNARKAFDMELRLLDSVEAVRANFPSICQLSSSSRAIHGERGPFANHEYAGFHQEVIERMVEDGIAVVHLLILDRTPAAFHYGFVYCEKYYNFQTGFDSRLKQYRPGDVCLQLVFDDLMRRGVKEFDFLRGDHAYKRHFASEQRDTETTLIFRRAGLLYSTQRLRTRVYSRLRGWLKNRLLLMGKGEPDGRSPGTPS